ncbi:MAG: CHC2 zinc finger domain-containing protein, partial [Cyanobacteria bacterium J06576_12]
MGSTPRIHPDTIDDVRQRADIVDIISEQVVLKKQGKDFVGLCPFHDDKSPSFSVSPSKQFYYCFSCGAGGNAFKFLMEIGQRSFSDVVMDLARRYQVPVKTTEPAQQQEFQRKLTLREQLYEIVAVASKFYEHALFQPDGKQALNYLRNERKLSDDTIRHFEMGYAPDGWQTLYSYLVEQKHYPVNLVEQAGLIVPRKGGSGYYDRFRDRVMVPIHDVQTRLIGFGGRGLTAVLLAAFLLWGLRPGPLFMEQNPEFAWGLIASMYLGNMALLVISIFAIPLFVQMIKVPYRVLGP